MKSNYLLLTVDTVTVIGELQLQYLDGKNFCTLKNTAIGFTVQHGGKVMASESYDRLYESPKLTKEVTSAFADQVSRKRQK